MQNITAGFIGLGLIGGSIARALKKRAPSTVIMAYMRTRETLLTASRDGAVDIVLDGIGEPLRQCDIIFLCTPVEYNEEYLRQLQPYLKPGTIVTDVGSTKTQIHEAARALSMEESFIGGHPMAGSEKTGYENSTDHLLENAYYILTPTEQTPASSTALMTELASLIGAIPIVLDFREHDRIVAAVSHLPHLIASSLVNLVREDDKESGMMKQLAAGGFKDITRIASAPPVMWEQICMTNSSNIASMLEEYIGSLQQILVQLKGHDSPAVRNLFETARTYRDSFEKRTSGPISPDYSFSVDVCDEPGAISIISAILAGKGISIKNIGINHNREGGEGALSITFYDEAARQAAWDRLKKYNYTLFNF